MSQENPAGLGTTGSSAADADRRSDDLVRQLDWHLRSQLALRDQLLADVAREDRMIKQYEEEMAKDQELIEERMKTLEAIKARTKERDEKRVLREQKMELIRQKIDQMEKETGVKLKKIHDKAELLQKLQTNLPSLVQQMKDKFEDRQQSVYDFRLAFGLTSLVDFLPKEPE